jgi:hypothetical protein
MNFPLGISTSFIPMLLVISLGDWASTRQPNWIIPKITNEDKNIDSGRGICCWLLIRWRSRNFSNAMKLYHAKHCRSKTRRFYPRPIQDHLCRASDLMLVLSGAKVESLLPH